MKFFKLQIFLTVLFIYSNLSISQTWVQQTSVAGSSLKSIQILDEYTVLICGFNGNILKTTNGGENWLLKNNSAGENLFTLKFFNSFTGYAIGGNGSSGIIYKTTNSGDNWSKTLVMMDSLQSFFRCNFYSENVWFSIALVYDGSLGTATSLFRTTNSGINWTRISFLIPTEYMSEVYFINETTGHYVSRRTSSPMFGYDYKTTNGGLNWTYKALGANSYSVFFQDINTGFSGGDGGFIWKTTNGGNNWINAQCCPGGLQGAFSFPSLNTGYSAGYGKIYKTTNGGDNWINASASFTNIVYYDIKFYNDSIGYCVGDAGTILKTTTGGVSVIKQIGTEIPLKYKLSQNYPNPFNPSTQISFDIPKSSFVMLVVYDHLGREVEQLVNEELNPGSFKYDWNASSFPSGIYYYKLQAGEYSETKKMVLLK